MPSSLIAKLKSSDVISLWTSMIVSEKDVRLFGFQSRDEQVMFDTLNSVSGVGPKSALGILSKESVDDIIAAIRSDDVSIFTAVSGIGRKSASKIIIELKGKFMKNADVDMKSMLKDHEDASDIVQALTKLGYKSSEINKALAGIDQSLSTEKKIKEVLKSI